MSPHVQVVLLPMIMTPPLGEEALPHTQKHKYVYKETNKKIQDKIQSHQWMKIT